jgi:hypothetical protein
VPVDRQVGKRNSNVGVKELGAAGCIQQTSTSFTAPDYWSQVGCFASWMLDLLNDWRHALGIAPWPPHRAVREGWHRFRSGRSTRRDCLPSLLAASSGSIPSVRPPVLLIAYPVQCAVVAATQRHGEFVADLATQCPRLGKPQVVRVGTPESPAANDLIFETRMLLVKVTITKLYNFKFYILA